MRTFVLALCVASLAMPAVADQNWMLPPDGVYCPAKGQDIYAIVVGPNGGLGIDGLDCPVVTLSRGRVRSPKCWANGDSEAPYETDLLILPSGSMVHGSVLFRRWTGPLPCPHS
ncbi:hypothetical protein SAMN05216360_102355 [Methylobacterium phyllostachyos]|uniref:Secreted protein n=1 Tax=Methylobacterium phyllostachyos TaxID=582672 RepID=A0A1G9U0J7_9HYPH|nr:hypothetical protein [Methylobacterium phyllostachyos]SDM53055.1 hypothetical protein SAMN05216360_102355 [Methylobacterium phyllostachyos]